MAFGITTLLSILFPLTEDEKNILKLQAQDFQNKYSLQNIHGIYALSSFKDKAVRSALHLNKFHNHRQAQALLAVLLERFLTEQTGEYPVRIVPIPLSRRRQRERGHNQVLSVINALNALPKRYSVHKDILIKVHDTKPQTSLSKKERIQNLFGAYACTHHASAEVQDAHIVLIDDVTTTGTTLTEAKHVLKKLKPASITCVALAH